MEMTDLAIQVLYRLFKAAIFVPMIGLITWWIFSNWLVEQTLTAEEAGIGLALTAIAFGLGVTSILMGGWGFLAVLAILYALLLTVGVWEYLYWRRREREHLISEVSRYTEAIDLDPRNAAAYSFLGENLLKLGRFEDAESAFETALDLDPESRRDRNLLRRARERRAYLPWVRLD